ncbi:MAG: hypothetical protein FJ144_04660 [Deltaproteobacteria bacterium]|nr:hypothetical protein [Deltaproteobacteria bacterium]
MKKTAIIAALSIAAALLLGTPAQSQDMEQMAKIPPPVRAKAQTAFLEKKLQLNPEQKSKVEAINLKYAEKMQPVLDGSAGGMFARMREGKKLEGEKDAELRGVLNPQQFQTYEASKDEMKQKVLQELKEKRAAGQ